MVGRQGQSKRTGHSLREQLQDIGVTDLEPGAVVTVVDSKLSFPHNLFRKIHERRFAVVLSNHELCRNVATRLLVIVPMTHRTNLRSETDVFIERAPENGLLFYSLAQLTLIQPLIKTDVKQKLGVLSDAHYESILEHLVLMTARDLQA